MNKLKKKLRQCQLDVWRMQHHSARDYTYYSPVHATYSRLDFFLVEHWLLEVEGTNIGTMTFSDHAPVSLQLKIGPRKNLCNSWRLNKDLLFHDRVIDKRIKEELELYFKMNVPGETSEATVWEAYKAYIRGILIMVGTEEERRKINYLCKKKYMTWNNNIRKLWMGTSWQAYLGRERLCGF